MAEIGHESLSIVAYAKILSALDPDSATVFSYLKNWLRSLRLSIPPISYQKRKTPTLSC